MTGNHSGSPWRIKGVEADCVHMWENKGKSASEIARSLNRKYRLDMSRNAVIGRIHRLGLTRSPEAIAAAEQHGRAARAKLIAAKPPRPVKPVTVKAYGSPQMKPLQRPIPPPVHVAQARNLSIVELSARHCRWIEGEAHAGSIYCGADADEGCPYCPAHRARAWGGMAKKPQRLERLFR